MNYLNKILVGDCRKVLKELPVAYYHTIITSPPYFGLRDYEAGEDELGKEEAVSDYVRHLVDVGRELFRVLRNDGTFWLNLADTYASAWPCQRRNLIGTGSLPNGKRAARPPRLPNGLKEKDLIGVPWRVALALQADGWYLRSDIIWKKNSMPESVEDRCAKNHEYIFMFSKAPKYYFNRLTERNEEGQLVSTRSVWSLPVSRSKVQHFAAFPKALPKRCIQASTSPRGCCNGCGAPVVPVVHKVRKPTRSGATSKVHNTDGDRKKIGNRDPQRHVTVRTITGWEYSCKCPEAETDWEPCRVLDPFMGSGTTALVAKAMGRDYTGIELNPEYARMAEQRLAKAVKGFGLS